ncbi:MAG: bifunctional precorrin-2 dehydrogenase/sirohydrochlorin ferrochelatase [Magnetococcales bacterium]|nr:bifunctional precorrin-2 dehydrogenase/sirohydrochlorin ferrochelatase [Magnetococcales bacterium]
MNITVIPQFLQLLDRPCLMLGDNHEAVNKGEALIKAGAKLMVIADNHQLWPEELSKKITWIPGPFSPEQLDGIWLVVSAIEDRSINSELFNACQKRQIFLNVVDKPEYCSFIWPAVVKKPPFTIAISTGGRGPVLAGWLRRKLENELPDNLEEMADWFVEWRKKITPIIPNLQERGKFWRTMFSSGLLDIFLSGDSQKADKIINRALKQQKKC